MKLLVTGGHVTPAIAFIDELIDHNRTKASNIVFVGRKFTSVREREHSFEYQEIHKRGIRFIHLPAVRSGGFLFFTILKNIFTMPRSLVRAWQIISKEKPYAVLTFGGYIALPVACIAYVRRIPVYTHEQTLVPGLTNRIIGRFAYRIFVSFPQTRAFFPKSKTIVTGNPIRKDIFKVETAAFTINKHVPVIYVTGASLGSHSLNLHIEKLLPELLENYIIIHQTGSVREYDDYKRLELFRDTLPSSLKKNYFLKPHFTSDEIGHVFKLADLVISRSGANTVIELIALKKPAILVPLPWAKYKEQEQQAQLLQKAGAAEIFHQNETNDKLHDQITMVMHNLPEYTSNFDKLQNLYNPNAAEIIAKHILR